MFSAVRPYSSYSFAGEPDWPNLSSTPTRAKPAPGLPAMTSRHGGAEAAGDEVILRRDDGADLAVVGKDALFIKRLYGVEVHDRGADTLGREAPPP